MKNIFKIILTGLASVMFLIGCEDIEPEAPISPDNYPTATFTTSFTGGEVSEGEVITYKITIDKPIDADLTFSARLPIIDSIVTSSDIDIVVKDAIIPAYKTEAELTITFVLDDIPEVEEIIKLEVGVFDVGHRYLLNPKTSNPNLNLKVKNVNTEDGMTITMGWSNEDNDLDIFLIHETEGDWNLAGSSDNPEIMAPAIFTEDPAGKYFFTIDPYHVEGTSVNYTLRIGHPNQTVEIFTGVFDLTALDKYTIDYFEYWEVDTYRLAEITLEDGKFTVKHLGE